MNFVYSHIVANKMNTVNTINKYIVCFVHLNKKGVHEMDTLNKISELLSNQKKSQKDLCDYLGISKNVFTAWKSGKNNSYNRYIQRIAEFLDVDPNFLYGIGPQEDRRLAEMDFAFSELSEEDLKIIKRTKELPARKKKAILNLLDALEDDE